MRTYWLVNLFFLGVAVGAVSVMWYTTRYSSSIEQRRQACVELIH